MDIPKFSAKVREIGDEFGKCLFNRFYQKVPYMGNFFLQRHDAFEFFLSKFLHLGKSRQKSHKCCFYLFKREF